MELDWKRLSQRIREILEELVAMKSTTCSRAEQEPARYFADFFAALPYFQEHPEDMGCLAIPDDPYGRSVPYALLRGKTKDTVVLSGHFDVVSSEEYGAAEEFAYTLESPELEERLRALPLNDAQRAELDSGEWLWGRGVADMKGGLAVHAALFEQYAAQAANGALEGSLVFLPVPDEESYSAGMRAAAGILRALRERCGLNYRLLIDPEPTPETGGVQTVSLGSVGKVMPVVLVQGKKGHAGRFFEGLSALTVLSEICLRTNGSLTFSDAFENEAAVPPTWANLRDRKQGYDVSIPHRAAGYCTVLSLHTTPQEVLERLKTVCREAFACQVEALDSTYQQYRLRNGSSPEGRIAYEAKVLSFSELCTLLRDRDGEGFERFYERARAAAEAAVRAGQSYPDATVDLMEEVLNYSDIQYPVTVLGFAPPCYPPVHSDRVKGKEGAGSEAFRFLRAFTEEAFGQKLRAENYFMGISDLSYGAITAPFDYGSYSGNTPLWGGGYRIDFEAIEQNAIPSIIYGPIGREYHTYAERVNRHSLYRVTPAATHALIEHLWGADAPERGKN